MKKTLALGLLLPLALSACNLPLPGTSTSTATTGSAPDPKNRERIYFTSICDRGGSITCTGGPNFGGMMMGSFLT
ncbi:MAG: hypothetical protein M1281_12355, partial [Chloroflexi bacterium]|nr:hypothetical protein [Chloroflexota bacterium]